MASPFDDPAGGIDLNAGVLIGNGPNPLSGRFDGSGVLDWWPEAAMLHAVDLRGGRAVGYRNRWARTRQWSAANDPATSEDRVDSNPNVNVVAHAGESDQNSEPVFAPRPGSTEEGDGWILACVHRAATDTTDVVVLEATDIAAGPVATVELPRRIPAGFHGAWLPRSGQAKPGP